MSDGELTTKLGIDVIHMNDILSEIINDIVNGKIISKLDVVKRAEKFTRNERDLLIILGIDYIIKNTTNTKVVE